MLQSRGGISATALYLAAEPFQLLMFKQNFLRLILWLPSAIISVLKSPSIISASTTPSYQPPPQLGLAIGCTPN
jgi:hypothetical protein